MYFGGRESGRLENAWRRKRPLSVSSFLSSVVAQNSSRILPLPEEGAQSFAGAQKAERGKCLALRLRQNTTSNLERQRQRPGGPTEGKRGVYGDVGGPSGHGEGGRFCRTDEEGEEPESGQKKPARDCPIVEQQQEEFSLLSALCKCRAGSQTRTELSLSVGEVIWSKLRPTAALSK